MSAAEDRVRVEKRTYQATVSRGPEQWVVEVPELGVSTHARRIDQVESVASSAILLGPVEPEWGFDITAVMANPYLPNLSLPDVVVCDIDGTLALHDNRGPYDFDQVETDTVNKPVLDVLDALDHMGHEIILLSGRQEEYREHTKRWLEKHLIPYRALYMRAVGDRRSDDLVKMELFDQHIRDSYCVTLMLDDRDRCVRLWRMLGVPCFQVADGAF